MREEGYFETVSAFSSSSSPGGVLCLSWIFFLQFKLPGLRLNWRERERERERERKRALHANWRWNIVIGL
jgi:hypothetical protein